ncbi:MAG TPA: alpha/beta hydrolase [Chitinophagaceae bacterium]
MTKVYFISGLGADKRIFSFLDLSFCEPVYIDWITPYKNDTLQDYALKLRKGIPETDPIIVGISLGGMLVTEMANADSNIQGIIISSNKTQNEFPIHLRIVKYLPLYKWSPNFILKRIMLGSTWMLGGTRKEQKKLLQQIIKESNIEFVKWAIEAILCWKNTVIPENIIHIHGTADKLLPYSRVKADYTIPGGTHVMTMDNPEEISELLKKLIP